MTEILWTVKKTEKAKSFREIAFAFPALSEREVVLGDRKWRPHSPAGAQDHPGVVHDKEER
ncbi:hypothetical protein [Rhizobiales bacterium]|uniref:hypothetical protein n=1 Tax=Ensifer sp. R-19 TaxID=3404055 RepID=UPI0013AF96A8